MIQEIYQEAKIWLEININKTKFLTNQESKEQYITIDDSKIAKVASYIYFG